MSRKQMIQTKLVFLGEAAVGKSSIVLRFVKDEFNTNSESTIGAAFLTAQVDVSEGQTIKYEIWDTGTAIPHAVQGCSIVLIPSAAGQERFHSLAPMYYRGAQAAIVVYDITNMQSFERAKSWVQELQVRGNPDVIIALTGNKAVRSGACTFGAVWNVMAVLQDLEEHRKVSPQMGKTYADQNGLIFRECSAKTNTNISELFEEIGMWWHRTLAVVRRCSF